MLTLGNKLTLNTQPIYKFVNKYSIDFDGSDQRIITDGADTVAQPTTYSFWCKSSTTGQNKGVFGHGGFSIGSFHFNENASRPFLYLGAAYVYWVANDSQDDGEWHHWVVYLDTNNINNCKLYVDGVLQATSSVNTGSINAYTESLTIGSERQVGGNSFEGQIDEFAVYDRELTQDEITRMYNTYYSPNRVANGNFSQIGNEEVSNGDFSQIGSEQVTNGDFATDSNWTKETGWTIANSKAVANTTGTQQIYQNVGLVNGKTYKISYSVSDFVSGAMYLSLNGNGFISPPSTSDDNNVVHYVTYSGSDGIIYFRGSPNVNASIDNVSVKEVGQDWQLQYTGTGDWSITDKLNFVNVNGGSAQLNVFEVGKTYKITLDYVFTSGTRLILPYDGSNFPSGGVITTTGSVNDYTYYYTPNSTTLLIYSDGNGNGSVDNISVKEVGQGWTIGGDDITIDDSKASFVNADTNSDYIQQNNVAVVGRTYKVNFDISNLGVGESVKLRYPFQNTSANANGSYSFVAEAADTPFRITPASTNGTFDIDNIVVQELKHDATNLMLNAGAYQSANPLITSTKSMEFDGIDDYLQLSEPFSYTNHTITSWVKITDETLTKIIFDTRDANGDGIVLFINSNERIEYRINASSFSPSNVLSANNWYNITASYDGSQAKIYLDGVLIASSSASQVISTTNNAVIGANFVYSQVFIGNITEVGAFNRALTSLEVASLYNQGMPTNLLVNRNDYQSGNPTVFNTKQVDFDGVDDYVEVQDSSDLQLAGQEASFAFWVRLDGLSGGDQKFLAKALTTGVDLGGYQIRTSNDDLIFQFYSGGAWRTVTSNSFFTNTGWVNVNVTINSSNLVKMYKNGVEVFSGSIGYSIPANSGELLFGARTPATPVNFLNGKLSQVGIWNTTLTADEVSSLYNHGLPIDLTTDQAAYESSSNLVGYWRMGSGTLDEYPLIADQTNATLGSELVTNGDFANGTTGWTTGNSGVLSIVDGALVVTGDGGSFASAKQIVTGVVGKTYKLTGKVAVVSGSYNVRVEADQPSWLNLFTTSSTDFVNFEAYFVCVNTSIDLRFTIYNATTTSSDKIKIDDISLKEIGGNPAMMINLGGGADFSDGIQNGSPYANIVQDSDFTLTGTQAQNTTGTYWTTGTGWTIANGVASCNNTIAAHLSQNALTLGVTYRVSYEIKDYTSGSIRINAGWGGYGTYRSSIGTYTENIVCTGNTFIEATSIGSGFIGSIDNVTITEVNTGLQGYWKMGDGTNDEYPVIYDQTNPTLSDEKVVDNNFPTPNNNWSLTLFTIANNKLHCISDGTYANAVQSNVFTVDKTYKITFDITGHTLGEIRVRPSGQSPFFTANANGSYTFYYTATNTELAIERNNAACNMFLENLSAKEVQGNPATMTNMVEGNITNQFPLTKIRNYYRMGDGILDGYPIIQDQTSPNLAHIPTTNLFLYSEDFNQSVWYARGFTKVGTTTGPNGTSGFEFLENNTDSNPAIVYTPDVSDGTPRTFGVYLKSSFSTSIALALTGSLKTTTINVTTDWQFFQCTDSNNDAQGPHIAGFSTITQGSGIKIFVSMPQVEAQSQATAYIKSDGIAAVRKSSTTNKFIYSEDFENPLFVWLKAGTVTPTSNYGVSPDGTQNSTRLVFGSSNNAFYKYSLHSGNTEANSIYVKGVSGETIKFGKGATVNAGEVFTLNGNWQRLEYISTTGNQFAINTYSGATARDIQIWGVQIEEQTQAETYAPTKGLPVTIDLFTENNYGTMTNMSASDIIEDTPNN